MTTQTPTSTPVPNPTSRADPEPVLDAALEAVSGLEFPPPHPFVSHAPMAVEALAALGRSEVIDDWVEGFVADLVEEPPPVTPAWGSGFDWWDTLGDPRLLPEWTGYLERAIADDGWRSVVGTWVPRLMPGLQAALFHGVIRTAHAVRAIEHVETPARRTELARAIGHWAVWFQPGQPVDGTAGDEDVPDAAVTAAAEGADCYVVEPTISNLHGVTGAMAVDLLTGHLAASDGAAAVAQVRAEHAILYRGVPRRPLDDRWSDWDDRIVGAATASRDPHQVKLVEACLRGYQMTGDGAFVDAATTVTGTSIG